MREVDLRSDTVTHPTPEMRKAMAEAEVGDDVFSDDPTLNKLEAMAAERLGKEAAVFVAENIVAHLGRDADFAQGAGHCRYDNVVHVPAVSWMRMAYHYAGKSACFLGQT